MIEEKKSSLTINSKDIVDDVDYIAEMLTLQTGAKIGRTNAIRVAVKSWFDANNNG